MGAYVIFGLSLFWWTRTSFRFLVTMSAALCLAVTLWKSHLAASSYAIWFFAPAAMGLLWPAVTCRTDSRPEKSGMFPCPNELSHQGE